VAVREAVLGVLLVALLAGGPGVAVAIPGPAAGDLEALARRLAGPATQAEAIAALGALGDPAVERLLRALKEGALYLRDGRSLLLSDDGTANDLRGQPAVDSAGQPLSLESGAEAITLDEPHFGLVQRILERFEIFGPSAEGRRAAVARLGNSDHPGAAALLAGALAGERDGAVRAAMVEALAKLQLATADAPTRADAARTLGRLRSEAALALLRARLDRETDPVVQRTVREAVRAIESHVAFRSVIGYLFNGLSLGAVLLIMSLGLAVTFGLMGIINMAHGEMLMIGSYTAYVVQETFAAHWAGGQDYYFVLALPLSFVAAGLVGLGLELGVIRFLYGRPLETLIVTWGIGMILQQAARLYFGDQTSVNPPTWLRGGVEPLAGLVLPWSRIFIIGLALAALAALSILLQRSYGGLRVRAVMQDRPMAACLGVSTRRVDAVTFALGTALAGIAGCALSLIGTVDPEVGKTYIVDSFMVVVLGGVGKLMGAVVAAFTIGVANKLLEPAIGGTAAAVYAKVAVLAIVIWFLQWRPTGLFPQRGRAAEAA
jgi:urea transport system permease protein